MTSEDLLSPDVRRFISKHIDSVEKLEILLLLRQRGNATFSGLDVSRELRTAEISASKRLMELERQGLLQSDGQSPPTFRYAPQSPADVATVTALAQAYHVARVRVITTIYSEPEDGAESFADAFRLHKKRDGNG